MKIKIIHNVSQYIYAILMGEVFLIPIQIVPKKKYKEKSLHKNRNIGTKKIILGVVYFFCFHF